MQRGESWSPSEASPFLKSWRLIDSRPLVFGFGSERLVPSVLYSSIRGIPCIDNDLLYYVHTYIQLYVRTVSNTITLRHTDTICEI